MVSDKCLIINVTLSRRVKQRNHLSRNLYEFQPPGLRWVPGWHNLRLVLTSRFDPKSSKCVDWDFCNICDKNAIKIESFEDWRLRSEDWGFGIEDCLLSVASRTPFEASQILTNGKKSSLSALQLHTSCDGLSSAKKHLIRQLSPPQSVLC